MEIIREREAKEVRSPCIDFTWKDDKYSGFSFACDDEGNIRMEELQPAAIANLERCKNEWAEQMVMEKKTYVHRWTEPAVGRCSCGKKVALEGFTNECECGKLYNMSGQELRPRAEWLEEELNDY